MSEKLPRLFDKVWIISDGQLVALYPSHRETYLSDFGDVFEFYICALNDFVEEFSIDSEKESHVRVSVDSTMNANSGVIQQLGL